MFIDIFNKKKISELFPFFMYLRCKILLYKYIY
jgi:hypothetical protein